MAGSTDYLPFATTTTPNVETQAAYSGSGHQLSGFSTGLAISAQLNKVWRQSSMAVAMLANFIIGMLGIVLSDDGNVANFVTQFKAAIQLFVSQGGGGVSVPFSATPVFDASQGNKFFIQLTGNVTSSTLVNLQNFQKLSFIIQEDGTGGRTFVPPANLPLAAIVTGANKTNVQEFIVDDDGDVYPTTTMTVT